MTPEVVELETAEQEPELSYDRASVAPSEGSQFDHTSRRPRGAGRSQAATYEHLPPGAKRDIFKDVYMPTVAKYLGKLSDPWGTSGPEHIRIFQSVWNEVFPRAPYTFSVAHGARCNVVRLVSFT